MAFVTDDCVLLGQEAMDAAIRAERSGRHAFVSPKQYLSTHDIEDLDAPLPSDVDPSRRFSARNLLCLYMAYLLDRAERDATQRQLPWPVQLRVARPAWQAERAAQGERALKQLVRHGFALIDIIRPLLSEKGGVPQGKALDALRKLKAMSAEEERLIFKLSREGHASVLEATAVAAGTIRETGRRVVAIADIGAGTSDFGAFMTGLPGRNVVAEIGGGSQVLREAGDYLDMQLRRFILDKVGLLEDDSAARGTSNRLRARARSNKEALFVEGNLTVEAGDDLVEVTLKEFLADRFVAGFSKRLREQFHKTLMIAVDCARRHPLDGRQTPVEILITGGGHAMPMVRALVEAPSVRWRYAEGAPDLVERPRDIEFNSVRRQLVVAIGGAVRDLPVQTPSVRV